MKLLQIPLLFVSIPLLTLGGEGTYHAARNRLQITVTCEEFMRDPPRALWLRVTGCTTDYLGASYRESNGQVKELFFPVRPPQQPATEPAVLVVATSDPQALAIAQPTIGSDLTPNQEAFLVMMLQIVTVVRASREVEGYARSGVLEMVQTRRALSGLSVPLAPGFIVLDLHARPSFMIPGIEIGAGLLALAMVALLARRKPAAATAAADAPALQGEATAVSDRAPGFPGAAADVMRLPRMMLVNVGPSDGPGEIEHAPSLGRRADVQRTIGEALPAIVFDGDGRGRAANGNAEVVLDLGNDDTVWTVVVDARGAAAAETLQALVRGTGWRLFVPKSGTFVDPSNLETHS